MNKVVLICLLFCLSATTQAQTIAQIKTTAEPIDGKLVNNFYNQDIKQYRSILSILQLDVFDYYKLDSLYSTDAKKNAFKATEGYTAKLTELQQKQTELKQQSYYVDFEPSYFERNNSIKYNLTTKSIKVMNEVYTNKYYDKPGYLQFDEIIFKSPKGIENETKEMKIGEVDYIKESMIFYLHDDVVGQKIQENKMNLRILYVFKFTDAIPVEGVDLYGKKITFYALTNTLEKVMIYHSKTGEIYYSYKIK